VADGGLTGTPPKRILALEGPVDVQQLVRPWRRATFAASAVAVVELAGLIVCGAYIVARPLAHAVEKRAVLKAEKPAYTTPAPVRREIARQHAAPARPKHTRAETKVLVLNGNGRNGAAHDAADRLQSLGYTITGAADARRRDYATTLVMYRAGFRPEGVRLARDLHLKVVGPLDGVTASTLRGGQLAVILGAK
jgi:hypothetical protein